MDDATEQPADDANGELEVDGACAECRLDAEADVKAELLEPGNCGGGERFVGELFERMTPPQRQRLVE